MQHREPENYMNEKNCRFTRRWRQDSSVPEWEISVADLSCSIRHLEGFNYIRQILEKREASVSELVGYGGCCTFEEDAGSVRVDLVAQAFPLQWNDERNEPDHNENLGFQTWDRPEAMRAIDTPSIKAVIAQLNREAKEALTVGDRPTYDQKMIECAAARRYLSETNGLRGKSRRFPDQKSRDVDLVRKAIERSLQAIRAKSSPLADYFVKTIRHSGSTWEYVGTDVWDFRDIGDPFGVLAGWEPEPEDPEVLAIRSQWTRNQRADAAATQEAILRKWQEKQKQEMSPRKLAERVYRETVKYHAPQDVMRAAKDELYRIINEQVRRKNGPHWWC